MDVEQLKRLAGEKFPSFGPNKIQEITRLVFETARRDGSSFADILESIPEGRLSFSRIKEHLLRIRYPDAYAWGIPVRESFAAVEIDPQAACDVKSPLKIYPKTIHVERGVEHSAVVSRLRALFPASVHVTIDRYKDFSSGSSYGPVEFNRRLDQFFVVKEQYDGVKPCPCTPGVVSCGYHNVNFGFGCPFDCSYCFLQNYTNSPGIVLPANMEDFFRAFAEHGRTGMRVGSGQTTDSLAFDPVTGFAPGIVEFFRAYPENIFEFKTKSDNIDGLLSVNGASNIVVAWSVNPQGVIDREEHHTAALSRRLEAAARCAAAGYRTAFHFDPIFYYPGWQDDYSVVVNEIVRVVPKDSVAWISLGTLRMTIRQKKMIENRFPLNTILSAELLTAPDGKVRYHQFVREGVYRYLLSLLRAHLPRTPLYLCMEDADMWRNLGIRPPWPGSS